MLVPILVIVALVVVAIAVAAKRIQANHLATNQVIPGVATGAPDSWAGAHTREARLHRRLRDAMKAVVTHRLRDDPSFATSREQLEREALAIDQRLIAAAAIPTAIDAAVLDQCERAIEGVEQAVRALVSSVGPAIEASVAAEIVERVDFVAQAHAELDRLYPTDVSAEGYAERMRVLGEEFAADAEQTPVGEPDPASEEGPGRSTPG